MRTRLALLLIVTSALAFGASALMTSHLGMREWPVAPAPETATRVIAPSEAAGRAATERDRPAQRAERSRADTAPDDATSATTPVSDGPRDTSRRQAMRRGDDAAADAPDADATEATEPPAEEPETPAAEPIPTAPAAPVETPHTRDDDVVAPATPAPAPNLSTTGGGESADDDDEVSRRSLRDRLETLP